MRHVVTVQQIALQGCDILLRASMFQTDAVIHSCVVDQSVEAASKPDGFVHGLRAVPGDREFGGNHVTCGTATLEFGLKLLGRGRISIDNHRNRTLPGNAPGNRRADALGAAGDEHNFICEL